jgi:hypothetical protein
MIPADSPDSPEVLPLIVERLVAADTTDLSSVLRAALSYSLSPEFAESPLAVELCSFAELHGVERLLGVLQAAEDELKAGGV